MKRWRSKDEEIPRRYSSTVSFISPFSILMFLALSVPKDVQARE
jgi:hypothetical protein